jgi:hypothetical protein
MEDLNLHELVSYSWNTSRGKKAFEVTYLEHHQLKFVGVLEHALLCFFHARNIGR